MGRWFRLANQSSKVATLDNEAERQISESSPSFCPCCGILFDNDKHKIKGPYISGPYRYVCENCWKKSYMFFPDKKAVFYGSSRFSETFISGENLRVQLDDRSMLKATGDSTQGIIELSISGKKIRTEIKKVHVSRLKFDPTNARLRHLTEKLNQKKIAEWLWEQPEVRELCNEIRFSKGLTEPLCIDSNYVVREGNERLACLRYLNEEAHNGEIEGVAEDQFEMAQCQILPEGTPEKDIAIWLARIHVRGKDKWRTINKAAYIYDLSHKYNLSYDDIKKALGMAKKTVQTTLTTYRATLDYGKKHRDDKQWMSKYSYYYEIFKNEQLKNWAKLNANLELFDEWVYSGKIPKGQDVRKLKQIIADDDLLKQFMDSESKQAKTILDSIDSAGSASLKPLVKAVDALHKFPRDELKTITLDPAKWKVIETLHNELDSFMKDAQAIKAT